MKKNKKGKPWSYERKKQLYGYAFLLPWIIGVIMFFIKPLVQAVRYSVSKIVIVPGGYTLDFRQFINYRYILFENPDFLRNLTESLTTTFLSVPVTLIFVLFISAVLNQKFHGRTLMRSIFFIPVIVTSGVIITYITKDPLSNDFLKQTSSPVNNTSALLQMNSLDGFLLSLGLPNQLIQPVLDASADIINLAWRTGIQILIMLAGMQTISGELYEAAAVEGASGWENFWKITFPMISPMMVLVSVYTIIDGFTNGSNVFMEFIRQMSSGGAIEQASALTLLYTVCVMSVAGIIFLIINRFAIYRNKQ